MSQKLRGSTGVRFDTSLVVVKSSYAGGQKNVYALQIVEIFAYKKSDLETLSDRKSFLQANIVRPPKKRSASTLDCKAEVH